MTMQAAEVTHPEEEKGYDGRYGAANPARE